MRLKNFDKYIKEKLLGYKPAYQEDIWKAIEEKLPPVRVPNGQGSWLLVASAALVITALVPFLLKFNNLATRQEQMVQMSSGNTGSTSLEKPSIIGSQQVNAFNSDQTTENQPNSGSGENVASGNRTNNVNSLNNNSGTLSQKLSGSNGIFTHKARHSLNRMTSSGNHNIQRLHNESQMGPDLSRKTTVASAEEHSTMGLIAIAPGDIDNEMDGDFANTHLHDDQLGKYADRMGVTNNSRWANWQSIFYPFWQNPAYTGSEGRYNFTVDDRIDDLSNFNGGHSINTHTTAAADMRINKLGMGIGVYYTNDFTNLSQQITEGLALSKVILSRGTTSVKIGASVNSINNNLFYNSLNFSDQVVPGIGFVNATKEKDLAGTTQAIGLNGGIWVSNPHLMTGFDVVNINTPHLEHIKEAEPLPRLWRGTLGYRFSTGSDFQWLPMLVMSRQSGVSQSSATLTVVFKNKYMLTAAYQDIDPKTGLGNVSVYAGVDINKHLRLFASHGMNAEYQAFGINEQFTHLGVKYQIL